jgi:hypothetical protein
MLKDKGFYLKEKGKKEMIINLDSIEEENIQNEEMQGFTQRQKEKSLKKHRMMELDDELSSLENKFKNFETKVQDIQAKNK